MPEIIGPFKLYPPDSGATGWGIADGGGWLPVILADRDACLIVAGMVQAGMDIGVLEKLRDRYNRATPSVSVTIEHITEHVD